ncbi:hypothetical protein FJY68_03940 [candidate division WOR-3 bacterium]|uniref:HNH domain-containing protein n=1 Tax=candidate division WOR-3 bacterium TaxID=2052148 RepID=A0A938BSW5_UNCW3|nr:hypothetical protein [candidate division WOR-3 bacterium]
MNYWRMAFRWGSQGFELWPTCRSKNVAAIGYFGYRMRPIVGDCSEVPVADFDNVWRRKWPENTTARVSLRRFIYEMKPGDIIYAKNGPRIVGRGKVVSEYLYDPAVMDDPDHPHDHYRRVEWNATFRPIPLKLGAEQWTVLPLNDSQLRSLGVAERTATARSRTMEAREGEVYRSEIQFRKRNSALIAAKKMHSDYRCEVCGMHYGERYGDTGRDYIVAHHLKPVGVRTRASVTRLSDIALVCSNCHDMLHRRIPPYSIELLRRLLKRSQRAELGAAEDS